MKTQSTDGALRDAGAANGAKESPLHPPDATGQGGGFASFARSCGQLPERFRSALETNPMAVVASIAGGSFVLGALFASRLGRVLAVATIQYGVKSLLDGPVGREIGSAVKSVLAPVDG